MSISKMVLLMIVTASKTYAHRLEDASPNSTFNLHVTTVMSTSIVVEVYRPPNLATAWVTYQEIRKDNQTSNASAEIRNVTIKSIKLEVTVVLRDLTPSTRYNICAVGVDNGADAIVKVCTRAKTFSRLDRAMNIIVAVVAVAVFLAVAIILTVVLKYCKPYFVFRKSLKFLRKRNSKVGTEDAQVPPQAQHSPTQVQHNERSTAF